MQGLELRGRFGCSDTGTCIEGLGFAGLYIQG